MGLTDKSGEYRILPNITAPPIESPQLYFEVTEDSFLFKTLCIECKSDHNGWNAAIFVLFLLQPPQTTASPPGWSIGVNTVFKCLTNQNILIQPNVQHNFLHLIMSDKAQKVFVHTAQTEMHIHVKENRTNVEHLHITQQITDPTYKTRIDNKITQNQSAYPTQLYDYTKFIICMEKKVTQNNLHILAWLDLEDVWSWNLSCSMDVLLYPEWHLTRVGSKSMNKQNKNQKAMLHTRDTMERFCNIELGKTQTLEHFHITVLIYRAICISSFFTQDLRTNTCKNDDTYLMQDRTWISSTCMENTWYKSWKTKSWLACGCDVSLNYPSR